VGATAARASYAARKIRGAQAPRSAATSGGRVEAVGAPLEAEIVVDDHRTTFFRGLPGISHICGVSNGRSLVDRSSAEHDPG
jgi:hypothetical protein